MSILDKMTMLALGICSVGSIIGCSDNGAAVEPDGTGQIGLALQAPAATAIQTASYAITGPMGYSQTGTVAATGATLINDVPAGTGYQVTLTATTSDAATCSGTASFDVTAKQLVSVTVPMTCLEAPRTGSVMVGGKLNICPTIDGISATPSEVDVGGSVALSAAAHDKDAGPNPLSFGWTSSSGTFSAANTQNPTFTCTGPGLVTVHLAVSDGDPLASCPDTSTAQVRCAVPKAAGTYVAGDFHNHTTCSDGTISMAKLVKKATDRGETPWGLDWFVQAGHGGNGNRNCTLVEDATLTTPAYPVNATFPLGPNTTWDAFGLTPKGDVSLNVPPPPGVTTRNMWRWQSVQEFQYPLIEYFNTFKNLPLFLGLETIAPGHEHVSMSIISGQIPNGLEAATLPAAPPYKPLGNANALAQWEYCFDRADTDTSRGTANAWDCSVVNSLNAADPSWNATAQKLIPAGGAGTGVKGHLKALESLKWMAANHPLGSYYVPAHLERAGQFNPDGNNGYNIESLRDFNNAAPTIAFGFETQPGHGASNGRGEYTRNRNQIGGVATDSVGGSTFGGTGVYGAVIGGVWDALLGEGRNWWFFASSDWHNRGTFSADDRRSTQDFFPGEYQRTYSLVRSGGNKPRPQMIVDGLRSGNNFSTGGQLIDRLAFIVCTSRPEATVAALAADAATTNTALEEAGCATMGEKLVVPAGTDLVVGIALRDPDGVNFSPYTFANPSLLQVGITQPINMPVLDHVDLIGGMVTGYKTPGTAGYAGAWPANAAWMLADGTTTGLGSVPDGAKNLTAAILRTFSGAGASAWTAVSSPIDGTKFLTMTFRIPAVAASQYVRLRGTDMPASVPFETDASGNPLADVYTNAIDPTMLRIPCTTTHSANSQFDGCPDHLQMATAPSPIAGQRAVSFDVAAWSDLWFYSNPVYIEVTGSTVVAGVK